MNWETILKRPSIPVPEPDRYFEYNPELLERIVEDWDKDNPARVIHIEPPSTPDPDMRMDDESIRFAPRRSKKFIKDAFRFITDRPIDNIQGLRSRLREEGYTITTLPSKWVRENYGEKIGRIAVPDEAVAHIIGVTPKIAEAQRKKYKGKSVRMPDRQRKVEDIQRWNRQKEDNKLDTLDGFAKFVNAKVDVDYPDDVAERTKKMLSEAFGRNKHDLYLSQKLMLNDLWIKQNIVKPVVNIMNKEKKEREEKEKKAREERNKLLAARSRKKRKTSERQIRQLENRLSAAERAGNTKQVTQLQNSIDAIRERNRKLDSGELERMEKMDWKTILKIEKFGYPKVEGVDYKMGKFKPKCRNEGCLRIANGTDGIGFCMPCEDDASGNRLTDPKSPHTRKNQMKNPTLPNIYVKDVKKAEEFNIKDLYFEEVFSMGMHRAEYEVNDEITLSIVGGAYHNSYPEKMLGSGQDYEEWEVGVLKNNKVIDQHPYMDEDDIRELIEELRKDD